MIDIFSTKKMWCITIYISVSTEIEPDKNDFRKNLTHGWRQAYGRIYSYLLVTRVFRFSYNVLTRSPASGLYFLKISRDVLELLVNENQSYCWMDSTAWSSGVTRSWEPIILQYLRIRTTRLRKSGTNRTTRWRTFLRLVAGRMGISLCQRSTGNVAVATVISTVFLSRSSCIFFLLIRTYCSTIHSLHYSSPLLCTTNCIILQIDHDMDNSCSCCARH